jgi:hypothetical protein
MGCNQTKGAGVEVALPPIDLTGLDGPSKFEAMLPFKRVNVESVEKKLKDATGEDKTLTLDKLREIFANDAVWADLKDNDSLLVKILSSEYLQEDGKISRDALILYAILLSVGTPKIKARVFYDVLQDNNQEFISASDKDFEGAYSTLVNLATKLLYSHLSLVSQESPKLSTDSLDKVDGLKEAWNETFLDDVYGAASKLPRAEWEAKVVATQKWLFDSKTVRGKVEKELGL